MKNKLHLLCLLLAVLVFITPTVRAEMYPFGFAFVAPKGQTPDTSSTIAGLCLGIYGEYEAIYGISLGGVFVTRELRGVQVSVFANDIKPEEAHNGNVDNLSFGLQIATFGNAYREDGKFVGMQFAINQNRHEGNGTFVGTQVSLLGNYSSGAKMYGFQAAIHGNGATNLSGFQIGIENWAKDLYGFQIGIYNKSKTLSGLQVGVWNHAETGAGVQIGIVNVCGAWGDARILPLVNVVF